MSNLKGGITLLCIAIHTAFWCTPLYLMGMARALVPHRGFREVVSKPMTRIIDGWVTTNRLLFRAMRVNRTEVAWGINDPLPRDGWYVVLSNHQGWSDILILQDVLLGHLPPLKFFVKKPLLWVPLLGVAMWFLDFPYVHRYSREQIAANPELREHDQIAVRRACDIFKTAPTSVLNFLEGTRFTPVKHAAQGSTYQHLLIPKAGGVHHVLATLGNQVDGVIDITIVYPDQVPSFWDYLCGRCAPVTVDVQTRLAPEPDPQAGGSTEIAHDTVRTWVDGVWHEKDLRIQQLSKGI